MFFRPSQRVGMGWLNDKGGKDSVNMSMLVNRGFESVLRQPEMSALVQCQRVSTTGLRKRKFSYLQILLLRPSFKASKPPLISTIL